MALAAEGTGFDTEDQADQNMEGCMVVGKVPQAASRALEETIRSPQLVERHMLSAEGRKENHSMGYIVSR